MSGLPKEGIYLEAALGVIGEQVAERIDELDRRRHRRMRIGIAGLAATTVLSGSLAAAAVTGAFGAPESEGDRGPVTISEPAQLRCVEADAQTAFFSANYRIPAEARLDVAMACEQARAMIAADDGGLSSSSPQELVVIAETLLQTALDDDGAIVSEASFGVISDMSLPDARTCVAESRTVVLFAAAGDAPPAQCAEIVQ